MANSDNCPNCDNIYGNEPRKIACGHILCHKCCMELFNKDENTLECPVCSVVHTYKSKNCFKKSLQQVAHIGFGKKTSTREMSFSSIMPMEKTSTVEKFSHKEVKRGSAAPPGAPQETSPSTAPPEPLIPPKPTPLMSSRSNVSENKFHGKTKISSTNGVAPPSLFDTIVPSPPVTDSVIARCHSCANKCQVIVCDHCDHFVCLKCAEKHRSTTKIDAQTLATKWNGCKTKYKSLIEKLNQYNRDRSQIEKDLAAISVAVEQRTRDAIQTIVNQRDCLIQQIDEHINQEQNLNKFKHNELAKDFRTIQQRYENALNGQDIGSYSQQDFLQDISQLQHKMVSRNDLIDTHVLRIPTISRYDQVSIEKLLGELRFSQQYPQLPLPPTPLMENTSHLNRQNGFSEPPPAPSSSTIQSQIQKHSSSSTSNENSATKILAGENSPNNPQDDFEKFRRMAAQIHQLFNAPYSKVINAAGAPGSNVSFAHQTSDGSQLTSTNDKNRFTSTVNQNKTNPTATFIKSWSVEQCAVPNFLCMTPFPSPKLFVVDKHGRVSVSSIPPKSIKPFEAFTLFPDGSDERIESVVASARFLIVYSRKKQDTMSGTIYFFTHDCKPVAPLNGIHQNIPVHHILCDEKRNRLYFLDRMRCTIYYHTLPNTAAEIESCMKTRGDFKQFSQNYSAFKMLQNDNLLGFYEKNQCTVHLYNKQTAEEVGQFKCEHFTDKFASWGIIAIRKDDVTLVFKVDESTDQETGSRQHIVYEVNRLTKQVIVKMQLSSVFGMILGPNSEIILGIRPAKDSGLVQCYVRK